MYPAAILITLSLTVATLAISWYARRYTATTVEFYLAGRAINVFTNASAICGDYFSAASFLGVAGAVYAFGMDGLWFGIGFAAGFVPVLLFFSSPLRRFGEYTLPDFLAARLQSRAARLAGVMLVQLIVLFYLAPQMMGAGAVWELLVGRGLFGAGAYTTGVVLTTLVMVAYTAIGGMRGTTWNQAIQFWVLLTAVALVVVLGFAAGFAYPRALAAASQTPLTQPSVMRVADLLRPNPVTGVAPVDQARLAMSESYWEKHVAPVLAHPDAQVAVLLPRPNRLHPTRPLTFNRPGAQYGPLDQLSLILTLVLGTSGLPHIMNRFYTNPSGPVARWTTVYVLLFASSFYLLAGMVGVMGRALVPGYINSGETAIGVQVVDGILISADTVLPFLAQSMGGTWTLGYVVAGAFAAVFSTIGGLLMASAASWGHDLFEQYVRPEAPEWVKVAVGKFAVVGMSVVAGVMGLWVPHLDLTRAYPALIALMVTWAFSIAASGFVPVLFMSIWWRGTTLRGALAGMLMGGGGAVAYILVNLLRLQGLLPASSLWSLMEELTFPTLFTVPLALLAIYTVSWFDRDNLPDNIDTIWIRIHGTARERQALDPIRHTAIRSGSS